MKKLFFLSLLFSLVIVSFVSALEVTYFSCDHPVLLSNGSPACVSCSPGFLFNNVTGSCDLSGDETSRTVLKPDSISRLGGKVFPENPTLGGLVVLIGAGFIVIKLLEGLSK